MKGRRETWLGAILLAWVAFWFWAFSFGYSDSFFRYDPWTRLPLLGAAVWGAALLPASGYLAWRGQPTLLRALAAYGCGVGGALIPLALTSFVLSRARGRWHLQGDDAMGAGIDVLVLIGLSLAIGLTLLIAWAVRAAARR